MIDYPALRAVALVVRTGSFEKAAGLLGVTPSAVSQRVKQMEERLGAVLVRRASPCTATETGAWLCRHADAVGLLEQALLERLPALAGEGGEAERPTVPIATHADSLATWFLPALSRFAERCDVLVDLAVDDQDHTADWLRHGRVLGAVAALERPVQGCRLVPLGALRYRAAASPAFLARHCPHGVTPEALRRAPALTFDRKDRLQTRWIARAFGIAITPPTHWLPSVQGFLDACRLGLGWGLHPESLVLADLASGALVELVADTALDLPLAWQVNRLAAARLEVLTKAVTAAARAALVPPEETRSL